MRQHKKNYCYGSQWNLTEAMLSLICEDWEKGKGKGEFCVMSYKVRLITSHKNLCVSASLRREASPLGREF